MRIRVGTISAYCEACGGEEFYPIAESSELACAGCGAHTSYSALLRQMVEETAKRAQARLELARSLRRR